MKVLWTSCWLSAVLAIGAVGPVFAASEGAGGDAGLQARIEFVKELVSADDKIRLRFSLDNKTATEISVLAWRTPLEGVWDDIFEVRLEGQAIAYIGPLAKRAPPSQEEYVTLAPGKSATAEVDLGEYYAIEKPGAYRVRLRTEILDLVRGPATGRAARLAVEPLAAPRPLVSNEAGFQLTATRRLPERGFPTGGGDPSASALPPTFERCDSLQESVIFWAQGKAAAAASIAAIGLHFLPETVRPLSERTTLWFGAYDRTRFETVKGNFLRMATAFSTSSIGYDCGTCPSPHHSVVAWVYPGLPYGIYICGRYFTIPDEGPGSKVGTLIHEMSHFRVVADTDDHASGPVACKNLARTNPSLAIANADSYELFAVNDPYVKLRPDETLATLPQEPTPDAVVDLDASPSSPATPVSAPGRLD